MRRCVESLPTDTSPAAVVPVIYAVVVGADALVVLPAPIATLFAYCAFAPLPIATPSVAAMLVPLPSAIAPLAFAVVLLPSATLPVPDARFALPMATAPSPFAVCARPSATAPPFDDPPFAVVAAEPIATFCPVAPAVLLSPSAIPYAPLAVAALPIAMPDVAPLATFDDAPSATLLVPAAVASVPIAIVSVPDAVAYVPYAKEPCPDAVVLIPSAAALVPEATAPHPIAVAPSPVACEPHPVANEFIPSARMFALAPAPFVVVGDNVTLPIVCALDDVVRNPDVLPVVTPSPALVADALPTALACAPKPYSPPVYIEPVP